MLSLWLLAVAVNAPAEDVVKVVRHAGGRRARRLREAAADTVAGS